MAVRSIIFETPALSSPLNCCFRDPKRCFRDQIVVFETPALSSPRYLLYGSPGRGCRVEGGGRWRVEGGGRRVEGGGWRVQGEWCRAKSVGWREESAGCRVQGRGFRVQVGAHRLHGFPPPSTLLPCDCATCPRTTVLIHFRCFQEKHRLALAHFPTPTPSGLQQWCGGRREGWGGMSTPLLHIPVDPTGPMAPMPGQWLQRLPSPRNSSTGGCQTRSGTWHLSLSSTWSTLNPTPYTLNLTPYTGTPTL